MIDTCNTQSAHYSDGCWTTGTGEHVIVILGSCRVLPYINYLHRLNQDNKYTVCLINLVNFAFNQSGVQVDPSQFTTQFENKPVLMDMIKRCKWFIHEYAESFDFLNTSREAEKNIYQHGMNPEIDITLPNFNDHMILENDYVAYDAPIPPDYIARGETEIEKFCAICKMSSFPEFAEVFRNSWRTTRFFWRPNHVSSKFTIWLFKLMNSKFLHMELTDDFWAAASREDLYQFPHTDTTERDRQEYGITWRKA